MMLAWVDLLIGLFTKRAGRGISKRRLLTAPNNVTFKNKASERCLRQHDNPNPE
jgi:hypothetical protein